jgi:hypothetical protein
MDHLRDDSFDDRMRPVSPLSEAELDDLDQAWKPIGLVAAVLIGDMGNVTRYLEWRDLWNDRRSITYDEGSPYDDLD